MEKVYPESADTKKGDGILEIDFRTLRRSSYEVMRRVLAGDDVVLVKKSPWNNHKPVRICRIIPYTDNTTK